MFTRVTRSKSGVKGVIASPSLAGHTTNNSKKGSGVRTLTSSFKVSKDSVAKKSTSAKVTIVAATRSAGTVKRTTKTTPTSSSSSSFSSSSSTVASKVSVAVTSTDTTTPTPAPTLSAGTTTTAVLSPQEQLAKGLLHLRTVSPALSRWIDNNDYSHILTSHLRKPDDPPPNYFRSLARGIISQQVSGAAAASILRKFIILFYTPPTLGEADPPSDFFPTPIQVLNRSTSELRSVGLSERKTQYMHSLATEFINEPSLSELHTLSNDEIIEKLTKVKGIGVWSVEMLLIFTLGRWDIFSIGDLGIQRGMAVWAGKDVSKLKKRAAGEDGKKKAAAKWKYMSESDMKRLSEQFSPWRSLFCLVMWKASDVSLEAVKEKGKVTQKGKGKQKKVEVEEDVGEEVEEEEDDMEMQVVR